MKQQFTCKKKWKQEISAQQNTFLHHIFIFVFFFLVEFSWEFSVLSRLVCICCLLSFMTIFVVLWQLFLNISLNRAENCRILFFKHTVNLIFYLFWVGFVSYVRLFSAYSYRDRAYGNTLSRKLIVISLYLIRKMNQFINEDKKLSFSHRYHYYLICVITKSIVFSLVFHNENWPFDINVLIFRKYFHFSL